MLADPHLPQEHRDAILLGRMTVEQAAEFVALRGEERRAAIEQDLTERFNPDLRAVREQEQRDAAQVNGLRLAAQIQAGVDRRKARRAALLAAVHRNTTDDGPSAA